MRIASGIVLACLLTAGDVDVARSAHAPQRMAGVVVITPAGAARLGTGAFADRDDVTGLPELDRTCRSLGVVAVEPFYPGTLREPCLASLADRLRVLRLAPDTAAEPVAARLAGLPCLTAAEVPAAPRLHYTPNDPAYGWQWHLPHVRAPEAWDLVRGATARQAVVAVIDTGLDLDHPEIAPSLWINGPEDLDGNGRLDTTDLDGVDQDGNGFVDDVCGWNFTDQHPFPGQGESHAGAVAACVSAATDNSFMGAGIGSGVRIMPLQGIASGYLVNGYVPMLYAADNGADVVNCSWGIPVHRAYEQAIVDAVWEAGVIVVAAGGEADTADYPAGYVHVLGVSATDRNDHRAFFAPWGGTIDLCAPGVDILTPWGGELEWMSGTSFASGLVAGLAGLVRAAQPQATAAGTVALLEDSAVDIDALNPGYEGQLGAGRIDARAALEQALTGAPAAGGGLALMCSPNPFNSSVSVAFELSRAGDGDAGGLRCPWRGVSRCWPGASWAAEHTSHAGTRRVFRRGPLPAPGVRRTRRLAAGRAGEVSSGRRCGLQARSSAEARKDGPDMADLKTQRNKASVAAFIAGVADEGRRADCKD